MANAIAGTFDQAGEGTKHSDSAVFLKTEFEVQNTIAEESRLPDSASQSPISPHDTEMGMTVEDESKRSGQPVHECETLAMACFTFNEPSLEDEPDQRVKLHGFTYNNELEAHTAMLRLNPNIDRAPAVKGQPDRSKLKITLILPSGAIETRIYPQPFESVDWTKTPRPLNQWRWKVFRKYLGYSPVRSKLHSLEKQWLIDLYKSRKREMEVKGQAVNWTHMNWGEITKEFNERFEGRILPGRPLPRPPRQCNTLSHAGLHIKAIVKLTGRKSGRYQGKKAALTHTETSPRRENSN